MRIVKTTGLSQATRWGMERVCERWNVIIQQRQTPLNTYRVLLWRPLSQREKDLEKKTWSSVVALSPANWVGRL